MLLSIRVLFAFIFFLSYKNIILNFSFCSFFNIKLLRMRNIITFIILLNFCTFIIVINFYISFSRYILIKDTLVLTYKTFVNVVL